MHLIEYAYTPRPSVRWGKLIVDRWNFYSPEKTRLWATLVMTVSHASASLCVSARVSVRVGGGVSGVMS